MNGAAPDIAPLIPLLQRRRFVDVRPWVVTAYPIEVTEVPDDTTRLASRADLDALVELYSTFEFVGGLTAWQLRAMLRHVLDRHYVIVVEWPGDDAGFAGAVAITTRTRRYGVLDLLTVVPDHRGAGWSWALVAHAQSIGNALGIAGIAALAGSNPMDLEDHLGDDRYVAVELGAAATVPRPGSPARAVRSLATAPTESAGLVPRTGRPVGPQRGLTFDGRRRDRPKRDEAAIRGPPLPNRVRRVGSAHRALATPTVVVVEKLQKLGFHALSGLNSRSLVLHGLGPSACGRSFASPHQLIVANTVRAISTICGLEMVSIRADIVMLLAILRCVSVSDLTTEGAIGRLGASPTVRSPTRASRSPRRRAAPVRAVDRERPADAAAGHLDLVDPADQAVEPDRPIG